MLGLSLPLIYADRTTAATSVLLLSGDGRVSEAIEFCRENPKAHFLLLDPPPGRLVRLKIMPSPQKMQQKQLIAKSIPEDRIEFVLWNADDEPLGAALSRWYDDHPDAAVTVFCDEFQSRSVRWSLDRRLSTGQAARTTIRPIASKSYDRRVWWTSKQGTMAFVRNWVGLILPLIQGDHQKWQECNPDQFRPAV